MVVKKKVSVLKTCFTSIFRRNFPFLLSFVPILKITMTETLGPSNPGVIQRKCCGLTPNCKVLREIEPQKEEPCWVKPAGTWWSAL